MYNLWKKRDLEGVQACEVCRATAAIGRSSFIRDDLAIDRAGRNVG